MSMSSNSQTLVALRLLFYYLTRESLNISELQLQRTTTDTIFRSIIRASNVVSISVHLHLHTAIGTRGRERAHVGEDVRDIIPRMAIQAGLEALLVKMVGNEAY